MTDATRVLVLGLDPERVPGPWDPAPMVAAIAEGMRGCAEAGLDAETCLVGTDGSQDVAAEVSAALERRSWDCVVVGRGLRTGEVETFELVMNLVHRLAPQAAIAFSAAPAELAEAVERSMLTR